MVVSFSYVYHWPGKRTTSLRSGFCWLIPLLFVRGAVDLCRVHQIHRPLLQSRAAISFEGVSEEHPVYRTQCTAGLLVLGAGDVRLWSSIDVSKQTEHHSHSENTGVNAAVLAAVPVCQVVGAVAAGQSWLWHGHPHKPFV